MSKIRKLKMEIILSRLKEVWRTSTMGGADFSNAWVEDISLPTSDREVTSFIKKRTKLWRNSWIVNPLEEIIKQIENEIKR